RIAARAKPGAEEDPGDVLAPATRAVQEVIRDAVTRYLPPDSDLGVLGILAFERRVRVVKQQFHGRRTDRLSRAGAVEMTSVIESPRRRLAELSPITQRTASMTFDFPQPFGPTTPTRLLGKGMMVGSTKDLKPASLILLNRIRRDYAMRL